MGWQSTLPGSAHPARPALCCGTRSPARNGVICPYGPHNLRGRARHRNLPSLARADRSSPPRMSRRGGWINSKTDDLAQLSSLVFGDVVEDRLPCLLLLVSEAGGFAGRHRIRIAAERSKLLLQFRVERNCAQVLAYLVDDGFGRADRRHQ